MDPIAAAATPTSADPTWFQVPLATMRRGAVSRTGDVFLYGGPRFPKSFADLPGAMSHAADMSAGAKGGVAVLEHGGRFHLARLSNAEYSALRGWELVQSQLGADPIDGYHRDVRAFVDGDYIFAPRM